LKRPGARTASETRGCRLANWFEKTRCPGLLGLTRSHFFLAELIGLLGVAAIELNQTNVFGVHNQPPVAIRPWSNQIACGHIPMTKRVFVFFCGHRTSVSCMHSCELIHTRCSLTIEDHGVDPRETCMNRTRAQIMPVR
jgi:hypothetical protein